jgi:hypothetical protein
MQLLVLGCTHPDLQARSDRSWTGSATTTWSGSSTRWACARGVDGEVEVLHNSQLGADQQAAFGVLVGGLIGWAPPGRRARSSGPSAPAQRGRAACGWSRSPSAPSTWSRSGWQRPKRWPPSTATRCEPGTEPERGHEQCPNRLGGSCAAPPVAPWRPHRSPSSRQRRWPADAWGADGTPGAAAAASNTHPGPSKKPD